MDTFIGRQIGNYHLTRILGQGGFANVYLGEHIQLNTKMAIKILRRGLDYGKVQQFINEAQALFDLEHPHIVRIHDFGIEDQLPYLVMNYAPNGSLRDRHPQGTQVPLATILSYVNQVADALKYAHDRKKIHRDVKPENMLVNARGEVLLSDFGLVEVAQPSISKVQSMHDLATKEVKIIGTPSYMSPEQFRERARSASDQYALGIVVYEWLSGELPFRGLFHALMYQHSYQIPPSLREKNSNISVTVEEVVMKALGKKADHRYPNIQLFAEALEQAAHKSTTRSYNSQSPTLLAQNAPTFVKTPSLSPQPSRTVNKSLTQPISLANAVYQTQQISQLEENSDTLYQPQTADRMTPPNQSLQTSQHFSQSSMDRKEPGRKDDWIGLRWFIFGGSLLTPIMFLVGTLFQIPTITIMSIVPGVISLVLGLLETGHFDQWYWLVGFLLGSPLTGLLYTVVNPAMKPHRLINLKQLVIVLSCLGYALFILAVIFSNFPAINSNSSWLLGYIGVGFMLSGWLLGFIYTTRTDGWGEWILFYIILAPFAGIMSVWDWDKEQNVKNKSNK